MAEWRELWTNGNAALRTALVLCIASVVLHVVSLIGPQRSPWYELVALLAVAAIAVVWWISIIEYRQRRPGAWNPMSPLPRRLPQGSFWTAVLLFAYTIFLFLRMQSDGEPVPYVGSSDSVRQGTDNHPLDARDAPVVQLFTAAISAILFSCVLTVVLAQRWGKYYGTRKGAA